MIQRVHTKPKKVVIDKCLELEFSLHDIPTLSSRWLALKSEGWQLFVCDQRRGFCEWDKKWITIPLWVLSRPKGQWIYYVAHEFAHAPEYTHRDTNGFILRDCHGAEFMAELKLLCPAEYLHYELDYKKSQAQEAGITKEHAHKAQDIKVQNLWDILSGD